MCAVVVWNSRSINYPVVAASTKNVGMVTARLIDYLHKIRGSSMKLIHIIGHSLGAHAAGFAGLYSKYKVSRITGIQINKTYVLSIIQIIRQT